MLIDDRDLRRMNGKLAGEPVALRFCRIHASEPFIIAVVDIDRIDRGNLCR